MYHDVVIYRERYKYISKQEKCVKHPGRIYEMFCQTCELPFCIQCTEHSKPKIWHSLIKWMKHRKHKTVDIITVYKRKRILFKDIIRNIRSETLFTSCFLLTEIKSDIQTCQTEISKRRNQMLTKAQRVRNLIDTVIHDVKLRHKHLINKLQQRGREMNRHSASIEIVEYKHEHSANRPIQFLLHLKKNRFQRTTKMPCLMQYALHFISEKINVEDIIHQLSEIQVTETEKRTKYLLKLMSTPVLQKSVRVSGGVSEIVHISCVTSNQFWISDTDKKLNLANIEGVTLYCITDIANYYGLHTVDSTGDLIYVDKNYNIKKLSKDHKVMSTVIHYKQPWRQCCVYCSPTNGDLLIGTYDTTALNRARINRYNTTGEQLQTIQHNNTGQNLYSSPVYITENRNGDVIVSDLDHGLVVTDRGCTHRFTYTGAPSESQLEPYGICTDALSHILVCDWYNNTVHMIDKDGNFMSMILTQEQGVYRPGGLVYDDKAHQFWVGSMNRLSAYRYMNNQYYLRSS